MRWILDYAYHKADGWHWGTDVYKTKKQAVEAARYYDGLHDMDTDVRNEDGIHREEKMR